MTHTLVPATEADGRIAALLAAVRLQRPAFEAAALRAEEERTLPADIVAMMRDLGLFWLKTPTELGGSELDPISFCDVLEEIAYYDASAGWAAMIGNGTRSRYASKSAIGPWPSAARSLSRTPSPQASSRPRDAPQLSQTGSSSRSSKPMQPSTPATPVDRWSIWRDR